MLNTYRKLLSMLDPRERRRAGLVFLLMLSIAVSEVLGVASVMPFMAVLANQEVVDSNKYLAGAFQLFGFERRESFLFALGLLFFVLLLGSLSLKALGLWAQLRFSYNRSFVWSSRLVAAYLRQPYEWFLNRHSADLATSILAEVDDVVWNALIPMLQVVAQSMVAVLLLALLVAVEPRLALIIGAIVGGGFAAISYFFRLRLKQLAEERLIATRARFHVVEEAFGGVKEVKIGGLEDQILRRFQLPSHIRMQRQISANLIAFLPSLAMQGLLFGGMLVALLYLIAVHGTFQDALPIVGLYALAGYRLMPAVQRVSEEGARLRASEATVDAIAKDLRALEMSAERTSDSTTERLGLTRALELRNITYGYPNAERLALNGVSLTIPASGSIGLVGSTGSGKTTLVDIMLGLLRPHSGSIVVDGRPIDEATVRRWQRSLGYVPQQIFLTDDSIAGNIAFGLQATHIDQASVERAARIANLHEFVVTELPDGYQAKVGERGVRLSGGQRQRIGIARALYHNPDALILDEATSALDNLTEHAVMEAVRTLSQKKTVIMIAHRLSTVRHCDCIYMLEQGRIVAQGTYDELIASDDRFRRLAATG